MLSTNTRKNKIILSDYPYRKDIANRLLLAECNSFELSLLHELLFQASKCRIADLTEALDCSEKRLMEALAIFSRIGLTMCKADTIYIDKELKKQFELLSFKFSNQSEPSFEQLQPLLQKVPINTLPTWYSIPRSTDNIFSSIIEKYLLTPKIYESYLKELLFEEPILHTIVDELFAHPELRLGTEELALRHNLSREKLEEYIILLEFHFVLTSCILEEQEYIVPFLEFKELLTHQKKHALQPLEADKVALEKPPLLIRTLQDQEEAMVRFRSMLDSWHESWGRHIPLLEKSVFEIERSLRQIPPNSWILVDDYIAQLTVPIGSQPAVCLSRTGKKWRYLLPNYSDKERAFIEEVLFELLHKVGITSCGSYEGSPSFTITPFGRVALGNI